MSTGPHVTCTLSYLTLPTVIAKCMAIITLLSCLTVLQDVKLILACNLYSAILYTQSYCSSLFLDAQKGITPLMAAAQQSHLEAMEVLLTECNCNINARDRVRCSV